jgi:predicted Zn-dependent protease
MRTAVQTGLLAGLAGLVIGDFSSVLASLPALLGQAAYARDFEREADREAIAVLQAQHMKPSRMVLFFERIEAWRKAHDEADTLPIALASHPADEERKRLFTEADTASAR